MNNLRKEFYNNYTIENMCANCHSIENLQVHHIIPLSIGGSNYPSNFVTLCGNCHEKLHNLKLGDNWKELQRIGIEKAKKEGKYKGGKPKDIDIQQLKEYIVKIENKEITKVEAAKRMNISRPTLDKYIKEHSEEAMYNAE